MLNNNLPIVVPSMMDFRRIHHTFTTQFTHELHKMAKYLWMFM